MRRNAKATLSGEELERLDMLALQDPVGQALLERDLRRLADGAETAARSIQQVAQLCGELQKSLEKAKE